MPFSKSLFQGGELTVDHRASPGLTENQARRMGYTADPKRLGEGQIFRCDTYGCPHCGGVFHKDPLKNDRPHCYICDTYICFFCSMASREPDYVHYTINELADKCRDGKFIVVGPDMSHLKLVPIDRRLEWPKDSSLPQG